MDLPPHHSWAVTPEQAIEIQNELRARLCPRAPKNFNPGTIGAGDAAYSVTDDRIYASFLLFSYPSLELLEASLVRGHARFPYLPGLLAFREGPFLLEAISELRRRPGLILVEGQGTAHPRSMGIAAHLGLILDVPSIGCAKARLYGKAAEPGLASGSMAPLADGGRTIGMVVRTRPGVKPVYVSPGHRMDLETSVEMVLRLCRGYRLPEPLRQAHLAANRLRNAEQPGRI